MPEKSVRDMSERERRHRSLSARTFRSTLAGSVILGLVALAVGLGLYSIAMANQLVSEAFNLSRGAAVIFYLLIMAAATVLVGWLLTKRMKKAFVDPINAIADAAAAYVQDKRDGKLDDEHFTRLNIRTGDEVENLSLVLADMERDLGELEADLTSVAAEKERIGTELSLANRIQADMLPHIFPAFPERSEVDIFAMMDPAREVGGDFYDFFLVDEDHLGIVIADVSGKGIPGALYMMTTKIILQNNAMLGISPAEILRRTNNTVCANNQEEMFITVWLGILDLNTGEIKAANAGHEYPIFKTPDGDFEMIKDKHGFVIGGMEGVDYTEYTLQMEPGSKLFLYTDGLPEAANADQEMFGLDRALDCLNGASDRSPRKIVENMQGAVSVFVGDEEQFDDLTMLCVQYLGKKPEGDTDMKELTLEARVENIDAVTDFVNGELEALGCPMKAQMQIDVAIDEIFANIASYAYSGGEGEATVHFSVEEEPRAAVITFLDRGIPYNPLKNEDPDVTLSAEDRQVGGLGIFLVKKTMDVVKYEYRNGRNILQIKKYF